MTLKVITEPARCTRLSFSSLGYKTGPGSTEHEMWSRPFPQALKGSNSALFTCKGLNEDCLDTNYIVKTLYLLK